MEGQKWHYHSSTTAQVNKTNNRVMRLKQIKRRKQVKAEKDACEIKLCFILVQNLIDQSGSVLENGKIQPIPFQVVICTSRKQVRENRRVKVQPRN